jgi:hypothetical protein
MPEQTTKDYLLGDPLSEVTRKERRMLLGVGILAITLVKTGLVPTKISALGVEFDKANQEALFAMLALVTLYFLAAFVIYAAADFLAWRRALHRERVEWARERVRRQRNGSEHEYSMEQEEVRHIARTSFATFRLAGPVSILRSTFEFLLPVFVGAYTLILLWSNRATI